MSSAPTPEWFTPFVSPDHIRLTAIKTIVSIWPELLEYLEDLPRPPFLSMDKLSYAVETLKEEYRL